MKKFKIVAAIIGMLIIMSIHAQDSIKKNIGLIRLDSINPNLYNDWVLIKIKVVPRDTAYYETKGGPYGEIILNSDGTFLTINDYNQSTSGIWNVKKGCIGLFLTKIDGKKWESRGYSYEREIVEITENKLIIGLQGREDYNYFYYLPKLKK